MAQDSSSAPDPEKNAQQRSLTILALLLKPVEYGMIGFVLIAVLWSAQKLQVLPKTFKGFGVEIELPRDQAAVIKESFAKIDRLGGEVVKLREELAILANDTVRLAGNSSLTAQSIIEEPQDTLVTAPLNLEKKSIQFGTGYSWIGTYTKEGDWIDSSVARGDALKSLPKPNALQGEKLTTVVDTNLRATAPQDNEIYFSESKRLGFLPVGTRFTVSSKPRLYDRAGVIQIWAEIETDYKPL